MNHPKGLLSKIANYSSQHPLGYRVMVYVCACSFLFILLSTALQLTLDYRREHKAIDQQVDLIRSSYLASLAKSLWDLDQGQIELQLKGIQNLPDVAYLTLDSNDVSIEDLTPPSEDHKVQTHSFELIHVTNQTGRKLGRLDVSFDLEAINSRIIKRSFNTFLTQTLLVLLIVLVILVIFQRQITRHLESMANYSREIGAGELEHSLTLNRQPPKKRDELDQLVTALNDMRQSIRMDIARREQEEQRLRYNRDQLQEMVERRTQSLLRAKEAAEEASNAKSRFLSTMSHEIRTPMNGMLGMIQLLESSELTSKQRDHIHVLHDATNGLLATFNNVLEYGRLVEGAYSVTPTCFSLHNLLHNLITLLAPEADRKKIDLVLNCGEDVIDHCSTEESSLRQILTNLLANAIKFTDQGTVQLNVRTLKQKGSKYHLRFEIIDSGIGIAPELQEHIFDRFTQADETITRRFGGTGLGLAICKELAEHLGGQIGLISQPGQGSTFWVEITLEAAQLTEQDTLPSTPPDSIIQPQSILLVEDVEINQQVVLGLLAEQRHQVTIASDGFEALKLGQEQPFDLILMDMHLPGLSGIEISRRLTNDPECINQHTRIIALTASVRPEDVHDYLEAGISNVIAKPVQKAQLFAAVRGDKVTVDTIPELTDKELTAIENDVPLLDQAIIGVHQQMLGPEKLATLMNGYCKVHDELWPKLQQSIDAGDDYEISQQAHKLAGACDTLGFTRASHGLRQLEELAEIGTAMNSEQLTELEQVMAQTITLARDWKP